MLFGRLKNGGTVRVVVTSDDSGVKKLASYFPEGPSLPRPERDTVEAGRKRGGPDAETRKTKARKSRDDDAPDGEPDAEAPASPPVKDEDETQGKPVRTVPHVPLKN